MSKRNIILIAIVAVILAGVVLLAVVMFNNNEFIKNITLSEDGVTHETLEFSANGLHPGETRAYTLNLKSVITDRYIISFAFEETKDGELKNYIDVILTYGDEKYECKLADLLDGQTLSFENVAIEADETAVITITYYMPEDVGNEAQKTTADFDIILTATRFS